jgi:hypothetical protein
MELLRDAGARIDSDAIRISGESAKSPQLYRAAREIAVEKNIPLVVVDGVVETSVELSGANSSGVAQPVVNSGGK